MKAADLESVGWDALVYRFGFGALVIGCGTGNGESLIATSSQPLDATKC